MKALNGTTVDGDWDLGSDWGIGGVRSVGAVHAM